MCNQAARQAPSFWAPTSTTLLSAHPLSQSLSLSLHRVTSAATLRSQQPAVLCYAYLAVSLGPSFALSLTTPFEVAPSCVPNPYAFMLSIPQCWWLCYCEYFVSIDVSFVCDVCWQEEFLRNRCAIKVISV